MPSPVNRPDGWSHRPRGSSGSIFAHQVAYEGNLDDQLARWPWRPLSSGLGIDVAAARSVASETALFPCSPFDRLAFAAREVAEQAEAARWLAGHNLPTTPPPPPAWPQSPWALAEAPSPWPCSTTASSPGGLAAGGAADSPCIAPAALESPAPGTLRYDGWLPGQPFVPEALQPPVVPLAQPTQAHTQPLAWQSIWPLPAAQPDDQATAPLQATAAPAGAAATRAAAAARVPATAQQATARSHRTSGGMPASPPTAEAPASPQRPASPLAPRIPQSTHRRWRSYVSTPDGQGLEVVAHGPRPPARPKQPGKSRSPQRKKVRFASQASAAPASAPAAYLATPPQAFAPAPAVRPAGVRSASDPSLEGVFPAWTGAHAAATAAPPTVAVTRPPSAPPALASSRVTGNWGGHAEPPTPPPLQTGAPTTFITPPTPPSPERRAPSLRLRRAAQRAALADAASPSPRPAPLVSVTETRIATPTPAGAGVGAADHVSHRNRLLEAAAHSPGLATTLLDAVTQGLRSPTPEPLHGPSATAPFPRAELAVLTPLLTLDWRTLVEDAAFAYLPRDAATTTAVNYAAIRLWGHDVTSFFRVRLEPDCGVLVMRNAGALNHFLRGHGLPDVRHTPIAFAEWRVFARLCTALEAREAAGTR